MGRVILAVAAFALAGCAGHTYWDKPGATQADFDQDKLACEYEANKATAGMMTYGPTGTAGYGAFQRDQLTVQCLQVKGWSLVTRPRSSYD